MHTFNIYKNQFGEIIPCQADLLKIAKLAFNEINKAKPYKIAESIVNLTDNKYTGRKYFSLFKKNSKTGKSKVPNDFSGVYIFYKSDGPVYVGISNTIIRRLRFHLYGKSCNQASLVYLIARERYKKKIGKYFNGLRHDFPFEDYRDNIQNEIRKNWNLFVYQMEGGYNLSFTEIFIAAELHTKWNSFNTH